MKNSIIHIKKSITLATAGMMLIGFLSPLRADSFDDQINQLNGVISSQQAQLNSLKAQEDTLQNKLSEINAQIASVRAQMQLAQARFNKITADLEQAKVDLAAKKSILAENVKIIYQEGGVTPLEMLASSGGFSQFIDRQQYMQNVKEKVQNSANAITALKTKLESEQKEQQKIIVEQQSLKYALDQQSYQQQQIIAQTQGSEAAYQSQIAGNKGKVSSLRAQQAAVIAASQRSAGGGPAGTGPACGGGYPAKWCNIAQDSTADSWGYYNRECVSYVAWKRWSVGQELPAWGRMGQANAKDWVVNPITGGPGWAQRSGYRVDGTPAVGAAAVFTSGYYGHVMFVEAINGNGVLVSQYNADNAGHFSMAYINPGSALYIH